MASFPPSTQNNPNRLLVGRRRMLGLLGASGIGMATSALGGLAGTGATKSGKSLGTVNQRGLTGIWYNPATSGQGLLFEAFPDLLGEGIGLILGGWFTFDTSAGGVEAQRWFSLSGELLDGKNASAVTIYRNVGGRFDEPPITFGQAVGSGSIQFDDCDTARFDYNLDDGQSGSIPLVRITSNLTCSSDGTSVGSADAGYSGAWYDPNTSGQGFLVELNPASEIAFLSWYTYAPDAASDAGPETQRWFTGQAAFASGERDITFTLYQTTGGVFDAEDPVATVAVGSAVLSFGSCTTASFNYQFSLGEMAGRSGTIHLGRATAAPGECVFGGSCALIPSETEGPYPLSSVLSNPAMVRSDITEDRTGIPLMLVLKLVDINNNCQPIPDAGVYVWHCDKDGVYSGYSNQTGGVNATGKTFLRGIQYSDANGQVVFGTVYPGWYNGRITHIHFQVYLGSLTGSRATATSQIAFPLDVTSAVYSTTLYATRGQNTSVTSFAADGIFRDGVSYQLANVAGSSTAGYVATLVVGIAG
ncbi:MAG: intradiol ring-cleavage dioxygenase [Xanthomonadales bacterium]|nr:intradiol ring-cleavage dioxygenase [Xanthomonadales bacterium]